MAYIPTGQLMMKAATVTPPRPPPPGAGYVWVPASDSIAGHWRRARPGETGTLPKGFKKRVQMGDGVYEDFVVKDGKLVSIGIKRSKARKECDAAGIPPAYISDCVRWRSPPVMRTMQDIKHVLTCRDMGIPPEQVEECRKALRAGMTPEQILQAIAETQQVPEVAPKSRLPIYLAIGAAGIAGLFVFLKRRKR